MSNQDELLLCAAQAFCLMLYEKYGIIVRAESVDVRDPNGTSEFNCFLRLVNSEPNGVTRAFATVDIDGYSGECHLISIRRNKTGSEYPNSWAPFTNIAYEYAELQQKIKLEA